MKIFLFAVTLLTITHIALGDQLSPRSLDPKFAEASEKAFNA